MITKKMRFIFLFVVIIFLLSFIKINSSEINVNVDSLVEEKLQEQDNVKVIVLLREPVMQSGTLSKAVISAVQDNVLADLDKDEFKIEHKYNSFTGFSGEVNKEGLEILKNNPNVLNIIYDRPVKAFLQDSVPLINGNLTHNLLINDLNIKGKDQTICVIDTGIDSTHPDLIGKILDGYNYVDNNDNYTDDNGHGTHVAGIAVANGGIIGVAPDANLISIKALNHSGVGSSADVIAGIDWCVNNASLYNISSISMSLGTDTTYSSYCDNSVDGLFFVNSINAAVAKNITVTVASGNKGSATDMPAPACIEKSTSVGATDKNDSIASYTNRNSVLDLLAPGGVDNNDNNNLTKINSTYINGGYAYDYGTSMATPHVAGAVVLLQQYKQQESGRSLTVDEIESALKNHGKIITDTDGSTFRRIDIYEALVSIDEKKPVVNLNADKIYIEFGVDDVIITGNASDTMLDEFILSIYLPNNTLLLSTINSSINLTSNDLIIVGDYNVTLIANDFNNNENIESLLFTVLNYPYVTLDNPVNYYNTTTNTDVTFACTAIDNINLSKIELYHNLNGNFIPDQTFLGNGSESYDINYTYLGILNDGDYIWNCLAYDNESDSNFASENFTFLIDTQIPNLTVTSPATDSRPSVFSYNVQDHGINNCKLYINDVLNETNSNVNIGSNSFSVYLPDGIHNWNISCTDYAGNVNMTNGSFSLSCVESWSYSSWGTCSGGSQSKTATDAHRCGTTDNRGALTQNCTEEESGGGDAAGGGTEGGGTTTVTEEPVTKEQPIAIDFSAEDSGILSGLEEDTFKIKINDEEHTITIDSVSPEEVTITISSDPITITLKLNEPQKVDINADGVNDLLFTLTFADEWEAKILVEKIIETPEETVVVANETNKTGWFGWLGITGGFTKTFRDAIDYTKENYYYVIILVIIIIGYFVFRFSYGRKRILKRVERDIRDHSIKSGGKKDVSGSGKEGSSNIFSKINNIFKKKKKKVDLHDIFEEEEKIEEESKKLRDMIGKLKED